jgi:hypothetical protein
MNEKKNEIQPLTKGVVNSQLKVENRYFWFDDGDDRIVRGHAVFNILRLKLS